MNSNCLAAQVFSRLRREFAIVAACYLRFKFEINAFYVC